MRIVSVVFPFRSTFRRLELEKRWWHRLFIVIFFVALFGTAVFTVWVTYAVFAPQVQAMPEIVSMVDTTQPGLSTQTDIDAILTANDRSLLPSGATLLPHGYHLDHSITLKQLGEKIKAKFPVYGSLDDEALARSVLAKYPQYRSVVSDADHNIQIDPRTGERVSPTTDNLDLTSFQPIIKTIQMPDGSTAKFAVTVSDDSITAQWNRAEHHRILAAIMWASLFSIVVFLFVNYLLQVAYRALLYVIFGSVGSQ